MKAIAAAILALWALGAWHHAHAQTYTTQTFAPGYSVTTGPNGYRAESHEYSPGQVTTEVTNDDNSSRSLMHRLCQGVRGCGDN